MPELPALRDLIPRLKGARAYRSFDREGMTFEDAPARVLVVRLSPLRDVDRSVTHQALEAALRRGLPGILVDLAFFPSRADSELLSASGIPWLHGTRSLRPAEAFDLVLISNSYALELINLPLLLLRSGIPVRASARDARFPPLLLGGSNASAARACIGENGDAIPDALFFGEGERAVAELARRLPELTGPAGEKETCGPGAAPRTPPGPTAPDPMFVRKTRVRGSMTPGGGAGVEPPPRVALPPCPDRKSDWLAAAAASIPGLWVAGPDGAPSVERAILRDPAPEELAPAGRILDTPEAGAARVSVNFGCPAFCAFCFEGYDRKPYREPDAGTILAAARAAKISLGAREIELSGFNVNTHRDFAALLSDLSERFERVSLKSQRVDLLEGTPGMLEAEFAVGKASFTLGVEGISPRLRRFLRKSLEDAPLDRLLKRLLSADAPVRELKLFFLITGRETAKDFAEFRLLARRVNTLRAAGGRAARVVASAGYLVRMPGTPLALDPPVFDEALLSRLAREAGSVARDEGLEFRLAADYAEYAATQALVLCGGEGLAALEALAARGLRYDGTLDRDAWPALAELLAARGRLDGARFVPGTPPGPALEGGALPAFLERAHESARAGEDPGYCLGAACRSCGACAGEERAALAGHRIAPAAPELLARLRATALRKRRLVPRLYRAFLPEAWDGALPETLAALILRELLAFAPGEADNLLSAQEAFFTRAALRDRFPAFHGETLVALLPWDAARLDAALGEAPPLSLRPRDGPAPEGFASLELTLPLPRMAPPEAERALRAFLDGARVPFHLEGKAAARRIAVADKGRKKGILAGGTLRAEGEGTLLELSALAKFDAAALFAHLGRAAAGAGLRVRELGI